MRRNDHCEVSLCRSIFHIVARTVFVGSGHALYLVHHIEPIGHFAEHGVLAVQMGRAALLHVNLLNILRHGNASTLFYACGHFFYLAFAESLAPDYIEL